MTAKLLVVSGAILALASGPALAGGGCAGGAHAEAPQTIADAPQSTAPETVVAIPYPLPTVDAETQTAAASVESTGTTTE